MRRQSSGARRPLIRMQRGLNESFKLIISLASDPGEYIAGLRKILRRRSEDYEDRAISFEVAQEHLGACRSNG